MDLVLHSPVGPSGQNNPEDVRLLRALLNVYRRQAGEPSLPMWATADPELFAAIARFQVAQGAAVASSTVAPQSSSWNALLNALATTRTSVAIVPPAHGRLTWDAGGTEGGRLHSRILHVPSANSGLTLGRGYDLRDRTRVDVQQHLCQAGVDPSHASNVAGGVRLVGRAAEQFIVAADLLDFELAPSCQLRLFEAVYARAEAEVQHICSRPALVAVYGRVDWPQLDRRIKEVLVDLHYRGDYPGAIQQHLQPSLVANDLKGFAQSLSQPSLWTAVPADRFERRKRFLA